MAQRRFATLWGHAISMCCFKWEIAEREGAGSACYPACWACISVGQAWLKGCVASEGRGKGYPFPPVGSASYWQSSSRAYRSVGQAWVVVPIHKNRCPVPKACTHVRQS